MRESGCYITIRTWKIHHVKIEVIFFVIASCTKIVIDVNLIINVKKLSRWGRVWRYQRGNQNPYRRRTDKTMAKRKM